MAREYSPDEKKSIRSREKTSFERELEQFSRDRNLDKVSPNVRIVMIVEFYQTLVSRQHLDVI